MLVVNLFAEFVAVKVPLPKSGCTKLLHVAIMLLGLSFEVVIVPVSSTKFPAELPA